MINFCKLIDNTFSIREGALRINNFLSEYLFVNNFRTMRLLKSTNTLFIEFSSMPKKDGDSAEISYDRYKKGTSEEYVYAVTRNFAITKQIMKFFALSERQKLTYKILIKSATIVHIEVCPPRIGEKKCPKCGKFLPFSAFGVNSSKVGGLQYWCKDCARDAIKELREQKKIKAKKNELLKPLESVPINSEPVKSIEQPKPNISIYTDEELYNELKRRGYSGTLTRTKTLE